VNGFLPDGFDQCGVVSGISLDMRNAQRIVFQKSSSWLQNYRQADKFVHLLKDYLIFIFCLEVPIKIYCTVD
jgi:hypothetical protein